MSVAALPAVSAAMTPAPTKGPAQAPQSASRADRVSLALVRSRDALEAVFRTVEAFDKAMGGLAYSRRSPLDPVPVPRPGDYRKADVAHRWIEAFPDPDAIRQMVETIERVLATAPSQDTTRLQLSIMLDAFPNAGKEPREAYFATLVHDVIDEGHPPHVVAEACRTLRRTSRFVPTVSELLGQCEAKRSTLESAKVRAADAIAMREASAVAVAADEMDPADWPDDYWFNACCAWRSSALRAEKMLWSDRLGPPPYQVGSRVPLAVRQRMGWPDEPDGSAL